MIELKHTKEMGEIRDRLEGLERLMEKMAQLPRDGSIPIRKPGERCKYEESHTPSAPSPKTHQRASVSD